MSHRDPVREVRSKIGIYVGHVHLKTDAAVRRHCEGGLFQQQLTPTTKPLGVPGQAGVLVARKDSAELVISEGDVLARVVVKLQIQHPSAVIIELLDRDLASGDAPGMKGAERAAVLVGPLPRVTTVTGSPVELETIGKRSSVSDLAVVGCI
jgi:hypothetical protein